ncbi:hypothetical protein [Sphingomonas sp. Leaf20]|uniref:hypothetical protein n=1 Tax=Sphingomonas sp. Leaf20 TaxID=1735685 RepID=UPI000A6AD5D3|nr:hypothetical protein [Sphingomonas sp. Leaf20]
MNTRPRFTHAYDELAIVAEHVRAQRAEGDPALVEQGRMTAAVAATRLRVAATIAIDWQHYAKLRLPPIDATTRPERIESIQGALAGHRQRMERARQAIANEYGEGFLVRSMTELWALVDSHDPSTARVRPFLHHEGCTAALEAMLWWERMPRDRGIRFLTRMNMDLRAMGYVVQERAAA